MLIPDHFVISVARRIQSAKAPYGPYHEHYLSVELQAPAANNRSEAKAKFDEVCRHYPEPQFHCTLTQVVCRAVFVAESSPEVCAH